MLHPHGDALSIEAVCTCGGERQVALGSVGGQCIACVEGARAVGVETRHHTAAGAVGGDVDRFVRQVAAANQVYVAPCGHCVALEMEVGPHRGHGQCCVGA